MRKSTMEKECGGNKAQLANVLEFVGQAISVSRGFYILQAGRGSSHFGHPIGDAVGYFVDHNQVVKGPSSVGLKEGDISVVELTS